MNELTLIVTVELTDITDSAELDKIGDIKAYKKMIESRTRETLKRAPGIDDANIKKVQVFVMDKDSIA